MFQNCIFLIFRNYHRTSFHFVLCFYMSELCPLLLLIVGNSQRERDLKGRSVKAKPACRRGRGAVKRNPLIGANKIQVIKAVSELLFYLLKYFF
jgi:hypothetical protein